MIFFTASVVGLADLSFGSCTSRLTPEPDFCGDSSQTIERAAAAVVAVEAMVQMELRIIEKRMELEAQFERLLEIWNLRE